MKSNKFTFYISFFLLSATFVTAQTSDNLFIFGSLQPIFMHETLDHRFKSLTGIGRDLDSGTVNDIKNELDHEFERNTFAVQQMDLFFNKYFANNFNVFVDVQFNLNFSSAKRWGNVNLTEAWINYAYSDFLNVKGGLILPKFNNLNEIKSRLPLHPYIMRPLIYEEILSDVFEQEDYVPERAFLQVSGFYPFGNLQLEYAAYIGNSESSYISSYSPNDDSGDFLTGVDTEGLKTKLYGMRIGAKKNDESFQVGLSMTYDHDNKQDTTVVMVAPVGVAYIPALGDVPRFRLGMDVSFKLLDFQFMTEYINVFYDLDKTKHPDVNMGQQYFFGTILYNVTDDLFAYTMYQIDLDNYSNRSANCLDFGAGYQINSSIVLKLQYTQFSEETERRTEFRWINGQKARFGMNYQLSTDFYMAGISVFF